VFRKPVVVLLFAALSAAASPALGQSGGTPVLSPVDLPSVPVVTAPQPANEAGQAPRSPRGRSTAACPTGPISFVFIDNSSIFDASDPNLQGRFGWAYRAANSLHVRTREEVIRRELLFGPGDCFDPFILDESERLLRAYDFLSAVDIHGVPQPDGSYHVIVDTRDDWSTQVDVRMRMDGNIRLEGIRVEETNLLGTGQKVGVFFFQRDVTRNYGVTYFTPQLLRTRWNFGADFGRTRAGTFVRQEISHPFIGEVSRWAARQSFLREERYFDYILSDLPEHRRTRLLVPVREAFFELAVVRRIGVPGSTTIVGTALTHHALSYPGAPSFVPDGRYADRAPADSAQAAAVLPQLVPLRNIRLSGMIGQRNIWWVKRRGLDSMRGQQDVALGGEALLALGRSLPAPDMDDDLLATLTLYSGLRLGEATLVGQGRLDTRRNLNAPAHSPEWEDFFAEGELLTYFQTRALPRQTLLLRLAGAGAWNTRTPFQLTLGGERALRGYAPERMPGARRAVASIENRFYLGWPAAHLFDLGGTLFGDIGRIWPGDAPFGLDSGWRASAGAGLRGSFPAGSRMTYRMDLAWPIDGNARFGDARLLLSVGEPLGIGGRRGDRQFRRSRPDGAADNLVRLR
jgi:hypothetical protein